MDHYMKDYMDHFYPIWIKNSGVILSFMTPLLLLLLLRKNRWGNVGLRVKTDLSCNSSSVT